MAKQYDPLGIFKAIRDSKDDAHIKAVYPAMFEYISRQAANGDQEAKELVRVATGQPKEPTTVYDLPF